MSFNDGDYNRKHPWEQYILKKHIYQKYSDKIKVIDDWVFEKRSGQLLHHIDTEESHNRIPEFAEFINENEIDVINLLKESKPLTIPFDINDDLQSENKINIVHLLNNINDDREINSIYSVKYLLEYKNISYKQVINPPYTVIPPEENCTYPERIGLTPIPNNKGFVITPGTYGCFKAHTDYILTITPKEGEIYLFFESDAKLNVPPTTFINMVNYAKTLMVDNNIDIFNFGEFFYHDQMVWEDKSTHIECGFLVGTYCYMLLKNGVMKLQEKIKKETWQSYDFWLSEQCEIKFGVFKSPLCGTFDGESLIDKLF
jgi:hypothetical protein